MPGPGKVATPNWLIRMLPSCPGPETPNSTRPFGSGSSLMATGAARDRREHGLSCDYVSFVVDIHALGNID